MILNEFPIHYIEEKSGKPSAPDDESILFQFK